MIEWSQIKHRFLKMGIPTGGERIFAFFARFTSTPTASNMASEWRYFGLFLYKLRCEIDVIGGNLADVKLSQNVIAVEEAAQLVC